MSTRKETTKFLSEILTQKRFSKPNVQYASEVVLDYGTKTPRRIDFVSFEPEHQMSVAGIEHGMVSCYEIKSCREDVFSGNGLNFVGDKNHLVTTMDCYKDILDDLRSGAFQKKIKSDNPESCDVPGILVAIPDGADPYAEFENPTPVNDRPGEWKLWSAKPCGRAYRKRSLTEMLYLMLRAGH